MAEEKKEAEREDLAESLEVLFTNFSAMIKGELEVVPAHSCFVLISLVLI